MKSSHCHLFSSRGFLQGLLLLFVFIPAAVLGQLSSGGQPLMTDLTKFRHDRHGKLIVELSPPDIYELERQDRSNEGSGLPERMGVSIPVNISTASAGVITGYSGNSVTWHINIRSRGATGLGLYFSEFLLPEGAHMFVYSEDKSHLLGAFTGFNNQRGGKFAIEVVKGESIVVEYTCPMQAMDEPSFVIDEVLYVYKPMLFNGEQVLKHLQSGNCEVNTACSEGDNWRNQIKSVVRIQVKKGNSAYWCTGTVMNNTASDFSPLVLTADHCAGTYPGPYSSADDVSKWIFYFNYEAPGCDGGTVAAGKTMTGAVKLASSTSVGNNGSDFYLVLLNEDIPASFQPFYAGWSRSGNVSPDGVGIHHPAGDVKKISTYTQPLTINQWGQIPGTHFRVVWSATEHGHGVTEGGSSGSPIFDNQGKVIGQLTGGESGCYNLTGPDYFGRFSYSWESNGLHDSTRLKPWLDPVNAGLTNLNGTYNDKRAVAVFTADTTVIPVGSGVIFSDLSIGDPTTWHWEFEGGEPAVSDLQSPELVRYNKMGVFNVKLTVTNQFGADSLVRENYVRVVPVLFPNPVFDEAYIMFGEKPESEITVSVINTLGQVVYEQQNFCFGNKSCRLELSGLQGGIYFVSIRGNGYLYSGKLLLIRR